jgi:hypothetical protein
MKTKLGPPSEHAEIVKLIKDGYQHGKNGAKLGEGHPGVEELPEPTGKFPKLNTGSPLPESEKGLWDCANSEDFKPSKPKR